jgi:hypothetical protein
MRVLSRARRVGQHAERQGTAAVQQLDRDRARRRNLQLRDNRSLAARHSRLDSVYAARVGRLNRLRHARQARGYRALRSCDGAGFGF